MNRSAQQERPRYAGPLYAQVADAIRDRIIEHEWPPGRPFPNETDLARAYGVSVGTMRKALGVLEDERLIVRYQGRGTFVADPASDSETLRLANLQIDGKPIDGQILLEDITTGTATTEEASQLQIGADERVIRLRRHYLAINELAGVETIAVACARFAGLEDEADLTAPSLFPIYHRKFGVFVAGTKETIFVGAPGSERQDFETPGPAGGPRLCIARVALDGSDVPVEWSLMHVLADGARLVGSCSRPLRKAQIDPLLAGSAAL